LDITNIQLIVGITNPTPDLTTQEKSDDHRHLDTANPFSYFQRYSMIHESILQDKNFNLDSKQISIVPFPIHNQNLWNFFIPKIAVQIMSVFEDWDREKKNRFVEYGYRVHELNCKRLISGNQVRQLIANNANLENYVPKGTLKVLKNLSRYE
jgi:hypothetical protein